MSLPRFFVLPLVADSTRGPNPKLRALNTACSPPIATQSPVPSTKNSSARAVREQGCADPSGSKESPEMLAWALNNTCHSPAMTAIAELRRDAARPDLSPRRLVLFVRRCRAGMVEASRELLDAAFGASRTREHTGQRLPAAQVHATNLLHRHSESEECSAEVRGQGLSIDSTSSTRPQQWGQSFS